MTRTTGCAVALAGALLLVPASLVGQKSAVPDSARLVGVVVDADTGTPIPGVSVRIAEPERAASTGPNGQFLIRDLPGGPLELVISQLGYFQHRQRLDASEVPGPLRIELRPDPIVLSGIRVQMDRFEQRRRSSGRSVRAFDRNSLLAAPVGAMDQWVATRAGLHLRPCRDPAELCVLRRGRLVRVNVVIDGQRALGGMDELLSYDPEDIHLVEIWDGRQVRLYTQAYIGSRAVQLAPQLMPHW